MDSEEHYNAADEAEVENLQKKQKNDREQELEDIKFLLKYPSGIRFFKRLFTEGRIFQTTFTGNSQTYFLEGHRNLALKFFSDVCEVSPNKISELMLLKKGKE